jgi:hypothetical protein
MRAFAATEYKKLFAHGDFIFNTSFLSKSTREKAAQADKHSRWHISTEFKTHDIGSKEFKTKINRANDVTYLLKYPLNDKYSGSIIQRKCNESSIEFNCIDNNYFFKADSYSFQTHENSASPIVLPHMNLDYQKEDILSGILSVNCDLLALHRRGKATESNNKTFLRSTNKIKWEKETSINGFVLDFQTGGRLDTYHSGNKQQYYKLSPLPILQNKVSVSYPLVSNIGRSNYSIWGPKYEIESSYFKKNKINRRNLFNEDSIFSGFDDVSVFYQSCLSGTDLVENSEKMTFGVENSIYNSKRRVCNFFVAKQQVLSNREGKRDSSMVGRLVIKPFDNLSLRYRYVGFPVMERTRATEVGGVLTVGRAALDAGYFYDTRESLTRKHPLSQLGFSGHYKISEYFTIMFLQIINLKKQEESQTMSRGIFIKYKDECFELSGGIYKTNYKDGDLRPSTGFMISFGFKNLGSVAQPTKTYLYRPPLSKVE